MINSNKKILVIFSFVILTILLNSQSVIACQCYAKTTVLNSYEDSDLVISTKLVSVKKVKEKADEDDIDYIKSVKMLIEKVYKGNVKVGDELTFAQGGGADCIWTYDEEQVGEKFLFFLDNATRGHPVLEDENPKNIELIYYPVTCGRSTELANAADDISFIENIEKYRGRTRISGKLQSGYKNSPSLANIEVKILSNDNVYKTKTDKNGFYEIIDIPAGIYVIEPSIPKGWKLSKLNLEYEPSYLYNNLSAIKEYNFKPDLQNEGQIPIFVREKRHAELNLFFIADTAIRGKVLSPTGEPMKGVRVTAFPEKIENIKDWGNYDLTNATGEYKIKSLPPGNYILVANDGGKISTNQPFNTLFYPNVSDRKNASIVSIELFKFLKDINLQIPSIVDLIEIKGQFLYSDGKHVAEEDINFIPNDIDKYDEIETESDSKGNFSLKIPKDASGKLFGKMYSRIGIFKDCKVHDEFFSKTGKKYMDVHTKEIKVNSDKNLLDVKLILPFPKCEEIDDQSFA